jgi:hypothetical protein
LSGVTDEELMEPYRDRIYRCLVKWKKRPGDGEQGSHPTFDFVDLQFDRPKEGRYSAAIVDVEFLRLWNIPDEVAQDAASHIEFALSGKPIIQRKAEIPLANVIDRFQDVRHVFNLPTVTATGAFRGMSVTRLNFGEFDLYNDLNVRRAALNSPVIINLAVKGSGVQVRADDLRSTLESKQYKFEEESPTRRGRCREYAPGSIEIFYPHNVYPFGVIGAKGGELVSLASGGLSGRVGNTLEGIARMMHDFFGCDDAVVLDEGYDTFLIVNPNAKEDEASRDRYLLDNSAFLQRIAGFSKALADADEVDSLRRAHERSGMYKDVGMKTWPLNQGLFAELDAFCSTEKIDYAQQDLNDMIAVRPNRSQMRAVLILAQKEAPVAPTS